MLIAVPVVALLAWAGYAAVEGKEEIKMLPLPATEYAPDKATKAGETRTLVVAGGCFWCVEGVFEQLDGVKGAVSGYAGGTKATANYKAVCTGETGHAEAVAVTYDPSKITFGELLQVFFTTHDPTSKNRQGADVGTQYRSAVFPLDDEQKKIAEEYIAKLNETKAFPKPVVTTVEPLKMADFYVAEDYHQDYAACNPNNPYIRGVAAPKIEKTKEKFADKLKKEEPAKK
ncbi:peptide-methionine (S)-S-oxide reductase MsrA [Humisphaera borealis]|uniref:Peptide methionine sulfoxide reductase MsrA n=1 Tax=Humisphaera borealis TaxID=2807512 RepID=A0A7M2X412_9BACT|nr:peptide-methionine (S)-S-oxide reductase MsrA [Humisphaera borealis]